MENTPKLGCVVMAAGNARRFGENKLAAQLRGRSLILRALEAVPAEKFHTVVVVTHEMGFAREVATRVIFIDEGNIKEENTPKEFFEHPQNPRLRDFLSKVL